MNCDEKQRLLTEYQRESARFSEAVDTLNRMMPISSKEDYDRLKRAADEARIGSERARLTLEQHTAVHGC
jgi:hypothetical protein